MRYALRRPEGPLGSMVQLLWFYEGGAASHHWERLLPDGTLELVINLDRDEIRIWDRRNLNYYEKLEGAALVGPHSEYFVIDTAQQRSVMGIHFRPGGASPFLRIPADELHGTHVALSDVWGAFARDLREQLLETPGIQARFDLLEAALWAQARRPFTLHSAVEFAAARFRCQTEATVAGLREATGLSARRFIDLFRQQVGMTPKEYARVCRFQRIVQRTPADGRIDWPQTALHAGYYDQSHLIHEFQAIAGISPCTWEGLRTAHRNHVPLQISTRRAEDDRRELRI